MEHKTTSSVKLLKVIAGSEALTQVVLGGLMISGWLESLRLRAAHTNPALFTIITGIGLLTLAAGPLLGSLLTRVNRRIPPGAERTGLSGQPDAAIAGSIVKVVLFWNGRDFGFVLYMMGGRLVWALILTILALLAILSSWPRQATD